MNLITLEEVKQWLGIDLEDTSKDLILNIWIEGVSETILNLIGRDIMAKDYIEKYPGTNKNAIVLKHYPINKIEEVAKVLDNEVQGLYTIDEIDINKKSGILYRDLAWWKTGGSNLMSGFINFPRRHIRIKYNAGYKEVPADLKLLALQMLGEQYAIMTSEGTKKGLKSYSISDVKYTWENENRLSQNQLGIINKYKGIRV